MDDQEKNLALCFQVLNDEYHIEEARRASILSRSGIFLQFSGVLAGVCVAQLVAIAAKSTVNYLIVAIYAVTLLLSVCSIILLTLAMKADKSMRFPNETINLDTVRQMSEIEYSLCLIRTSQQIIAFNQKQNSRKMSYYSGAIVCCAITAFLLFATFTADVLLSK